MPFAQPLLKPFQPAPLADRLVLKTRKASKGCINWLGGTRGTLRYGQVWFNGKMVSAHRVSFELFVGPIPDGLWVLHRCDNPQCVNPCHLFLGTNLDNSNDKIAKGRHRGGTGFGAAMSRKLTDQDVLAIRARVAAGEKQSKVAADYGMSNAAICTMIARKTWKHLP